MFTVQQTKARIVRVELGNFGDVKSVGRKVSELRVDVGPGHRIYLTRTELTVQLLFCGGDKPSQQADIKKAQEMVQELDGAKKAAKKKQPKKRQRKK